MEIRTDLTPHQLTAKIDHLFSLAGPKIQARHTSLDSSKGSPVYTVEGKYTTRGWTDWTMGFHIGSAILQYDATGDESFLELGREGTIRHMAPHVSHVGVHDHGFNNLSTYGNLRRLMLEGRIDHNQGELEFYELAIKVSGAIQAARWAKTIDGPGYIYSFNGPQSLFADTIRSLRILVLAHQLGHMLMGEADQKISLLGRALDHADVTARYNIYFGAERDHYDILGRVAHESIFNPNDGRYRCPSSQQGYSPFTTWTRGAAWIILGYAELLEFLAVVVDADLEPFGGRDKIEATFLKVARATCDYYIDGYTCLDGIPFWDTGAPGLVHLSDYRRQASDPHNPYEPVDSSAAAITAQGLIRLGRYLSEQGDQTAGQHYLQAGLTVAATLFAEPYLSTNPNHQGLILHAAYHRPNGWDRIPPGRQVPCDESVMWGDYHALELGLLIKRLAEGKYLTFFGPV